MPCWGKLALIRRRITASAARSASVTGSKSLALLLSIESDVRKNGKMVSPEEVARRPMKAVKSMTVTAVPWKEAGWRSSLLPSVIRQHAHDYPGHASGILVPNQRVGMGNFLMTGAITRLRVLAYQTSRTGGAV